MSSLRSKEAEAEGRPAMQVPSAMPSNIWWKTMTAKRVRKKESPATTRVRPITAEISGFWRSRGASGRTEGVKDNAGFEHHDAEFLVGGTVDVGRTMDVGSMVSEGVSVVRGH